MLTDLIAARVLELFQANAVAGDWCVTFTANGDEDVWVQVTADVVNVSYPRSTEPAATFGELGRNPRVLAWEPGKFATLQIDEAGDAAAIGKCSPDPVVTGGVGRARVVHERTVPDGRRFTGSEEGAFAA